MILERGIALRTTVVDDGEEFYITVTRFPNCIISRYVQDYRGRVLEHTPYCCHQEFERLIDLIKGASQ
jgi:hypothetical protein